MAGRAVIALLPVQGAIALAACVAMILGAAWLGARFRREGGHSDQREWEEVYLPVSAAVFVSAWAVRRETSAPGHHATGIDDAQILWLASGLPAAVCLAVVGVGLLAGESRDRKMVIGWACSAALLGLLALAGRTGLLDGQLLVLGVVAWCWWRTGRDERGPSGQANRTAMRGAGVFASMLVATSIAAGWLCGGLGGFAWGQIAMAGAFAGTIGSHVIAGAWGRSGVAASIAGALSVALGTGTVQLARVISEAVRSARGAMDSGVGPRWLGVLQSLVPPPGVSGFGVVSVEAVAAAGAAALLGAIAGGRVPPRWQRVLGGTLVITGVWLVFRGVL